MKIFNIIKKYKQEKNQIYVLNDLSYEFKKGKIYIIYGESGAGKSTLINILGLLDSNYEGEYSLSNHDMKKITDIDSSKIRARNIGMIFQDYYLNPRLNAYDNVYIAALINNNLSTKEKKERVLDVLNKMELGNRIKHKPNQLSGGEKQRVCIARAIVNNPDYILADEPTGALDKANKNNIMEILTKLKKQNKCIIMVTHDESLKKYADVILNLENGKLNEANTIS